MESKNWEDLLREMLSSHKPSGLEPDWDAFTDYMREHDLLEEITEDVQFDESLKSSLSSFEAGGTVAGWDRIESALEEDEVFDEEVRHRLKTFQPRYEPRTWALLMSRLTGAGYLRAKLIAFKVVEVAAVLLLLFTAVKMGRMGKLPFDTPLQPHASNGVLNSDRAMIPGESEDLLTGFSEKETNAAKLESSADRDQSFAEASIPSSEFEESSLNSFTNIGSSNSSSSETSSTGDRVRQYNITSQIASAVDPVNTAFNRNAPSEIGNISSAEITPGSQHDKKGSEQQKSGKRVMASAGFLSSTLSLIKWNDNIFMPRPRLTKQRARTYFEFGMITQVDYNRMRMPEDRFYSAGQQITFPQQGIPSTSLGGGFTMAFAHPRWAIESGLIYSSKSFKPGRQLIVGGDFDNGSVEFQAMRLQLVSLPLQYRYKIENKGAFRFYAMAGLGLHVIAQSDIDVLIKYHFPSLSIGENPNNDPYFAETIRESRRISEYIRDGAPFSTKSFVSVNGGLGAEYAIAGQKTLFLQSEIQYQVPNLKFSNNAGKHLRTVTIQAGVRTPFGN